MRIKNVQVVKFFVIALWCLCSGVTVSYGEIVDQIAARVNDEIILKSDIRMRMIQLNGMDGLMGLDKQRIGEMEKKLLEVMIEEKMFVQYADRQNIFIDDNEIDKSIQSLKRENNLSEDQLEEALKREGITIDEYKEFLKDQRQLSIVMGQEVSAKVFIEQSEIKKYYDDHINEFLSEDQVRVRHILFLAGKSDSTEKHEKAKKKAIDVLKRLNAGEDFVELAKLYSEDGSAAVGGDLGFFGKGKMIKEFEDIAFSLNPGEVSTVVLTAFGYHLIKCEEKKSSVPINFDEASLVINKKLFTQKAGERKKIFIEKLKKESIIERRL